MGYKILEIEDSWRITYQMDNIVCFIKDKKIPVFIKDLDIVLLNNPILNLSARLLNELSKNNILTIMCDEKHLPNCLILPISGHYNSLKILEKQIKWTDSFKFSIWKKIIKMKITQEENLLRNLKINVNLEFNLKNDTYESVQSIEVISAKTFFPLLFGNKFIRFDESIPSNKFINSLLNYGFTILMSAFARSIIKNGYDLRIGLFHKSFNNHFALASDLMEPFRVIVDFYVFKQIRKIQSERMMLSSSIKKDLIEILENDMLYNKNRIRISLGIDQYIKDMLEEKSPEIEFIYDIN